MISYASNWGAVAMATTSNALFMRMGELETGVNVTSPTGEDLGKSKVAAKQGLTMICTSRFIQSIPIFATPIII
jgi:hypothetical protein